MKDFVPQEDCSIENEEKDIFMETIDIIEDLTGVDINPIVYNSDDDKNDTDNN